LIRRKHEVKEHILQEASKAGASASEMMRRHGLYPEHMCNCPRPAEKLNDIGPQDDLHSLLHDEPHARVVTT
jgi:hypothetical protein